MDELGFLPMRNTIQNYAWGSLTAIAELLGRRPDNKIPQAELWMGAHPKAPSLVLVDNRWVSLDRLIESHPEKVLGKAVLDRFGPELPFLFKVLAAARPLSIQAHPNRQQAREGFRRENKLGIELTAPERNYKDERHKPECLCALGTFWAMCGFRPLDQARRLLKPLAGKELAPLVEGLEKNHPPQAVKEFFLSLLQMNPTQRRDAIRFALDSIRQNGLDDPAYGWIERLAASYPEDMGILAPALLNLVRLEAGQAIYLPAGQLHAYLEGVGVEIMANSDNVLRGGLTVKHIDIPELAKVVSFTSYTPRIIEPVQSAPAGEKIYPTPAAEFELAVIDTFSGSHHAILAGGKVQILLCIEGQAELEDTRTNATHKLEKGDSVLVPADVGQYSLRGRLRAFRAGIP